MDFKDYNFSVRDRFLNYVKIDTQSDPNSSSFPSTEKQKNLGRIVVEELKAMGIADAALDDFGYVYATIPSNSPKIIPVLCFCSHLDTSPDCSGLNVNPIVHLNYRGGNIVLKNDPSQIIQFEEHPDLQNQIGNDIITTDGTTLLGADNKAGVAEIMDAANYLILHPEIKHGVVKILFTPDEEIGRGVDRVDLKKLGAEVAYTIDGETKGTIENETFSADGAELNIYGVSTHPGFAKNKMENAIKIASRIISSLPSLKSPETTENKEPFIHPVSFAGGLEKVTIKFIIRAFDTPTLVSLGNELEETVKIVISEFKRSRYELKITPQYRNFKEILEKDPRLVTYAKEAIRRSGMKPLIQSIRGGTDGSRLSFMGLPCPNIFAGEHAFHSKLEWVSVQDMQKAVETIVCLASIWEEKSK